MIKGSASSGGAAAGAAGAGGALVCRRREHLLDSVRHDLRVGRKQCRRVLVDKSEADGVEESGAGGVEAGGVRGALLPAELFLGVAGGGGGGVAALEEVGVEWRADGVT